ncbi:MAG: hypothetical protein QOC97_1342, partial [Chloroflexota bacterium]|nr:hypothetical protein [Chloroflexota bacterium]
MAFFVLAAGFVAAFALALGTAFEAVLADVLVEAFDVVAVFFGAAL